MDSRRSGCDQRELPDATDQQRILSATLRRTVRECFAHPDLYLFSLRIYVLCSRGGAESAEKNPEINLRVSASPRAHETFEPSKIYFEPKG